MDFETLVKLLFATVILAAAIFSYITVMILLWKLIYLVEASHASSLLG